MPILDSNFKPPFLLENGHFQTIIPALFRKVGNCKYSRERIETPDGDFLDIDRLSSSNNKLAIISHGLEGSSEVDFIKGLARYFHKQNWDVAAWNYRGCSGELNRLKRFYHSGETKDLQSVLNHLSKDYTSISLIGLSLGGNISLKYAGEQSQQILPKIKSVIAISTPVDLESCAYQLEKFSNRIYLNRFLRSLKKKIKDKAKLFPDLELSLLKLSNTFHSFDNNFTAPLHGFRDVYDYYKKASSLPYLEKIRVPSLLLNARNDPFMSPECFPSKVAEQSQYLFLEAPSSGGHLGFFTGNFSEPTWLEQRIVTFANSYL